MKIFVWSFNTLHFSQELQSLESWSRIQRKHLKHNFGKDMCFLGDNLWHPSIQSIQGNPYTTRLTAVIPEARFPLMLEWMCLSIWMSSFLLCFSFPIDVSGTQGISAGTQVVVARSRGATMETARMSGNIAMCHTAVSSCQTELSLQSLSEGLQCWDWTKSHSLHCFYSCSGVLDTATGTICFCLTSRPLTPVKTQWHLFPSRRHFHLCWMMKETFVSCRWL